MLEEIPPAREWANKSLDYATTYLSGRWLEPYRDLSIEMPNISPKQRAEKGKNIGLWLDEFRYASALAAATDRWEDFSILSLGPHLDYPIPEIQGKDVRLHYVIAQYFLHGMSPPFLDRVQELIDGTSKFHRIVIQTFLAILQKDLDLQREGFAQVMAYYLKAAKKQKGDGIAVEGSFLYHFARRNGVLFEVDDEMRDHLIIF